MLAATATATALVAVTAAAPPSSWSADGALRFARGLAQRHTACDTAARLQRDAFARVLRVAGRVLR